MKGMWLLKMAVDMKACGHEGHVVVNGSGHEGHGLLLKVAVDMKGMLLLKVAVDMKGMWLLKVVVDMKGMW